MLQQRCAGTCSSRASIRNPVSLVFHSSGQPRPSSLRQRERRRCVSARAAATVEFAKYQGLGNDFILVRAFATRRGLPEDALLTIAHSHAPCRPVLAAACWRMRLEAYRKTRARLILYIAAG